MISAVLTQMSVVSRPDVCSVDTAVFARLELLAHVMHIAMCVDMRAGMRIDMCMDMCTCAHACVQTCK